VGQVNTRENRLYFDTWTSFPSRSARKDPKPAPRDAEVQDYRIDATVAPDLSLNVITRVKVRANTTLPVVNFDIAREMSVTEVRVDGAPAEVLQGESVRVNLTRGGNNLFLVVPPEPLQPGRDHEFGFRHSGKVIHDAGDHVFYVSARANWYPASGLLCQLRPYLPLPARVGSVCRRRHRGPHRGRHLHRAATPRAPVRVAAFNSVTTRMPGGRRLRGTCVPIANSKPPCSPAPRPRSRPVCLREQEFRGAAPIP
jgi:hypothetical protein